MFCLLVLCGSRGLGLRSGGSSLSHITALLGFLRSGIKGVNVVFAILLHKVGKILDSALARELNGRVLGTGGVKSDGRESSNRVRDIVGRRIDFGDGNLSRQFGVVSVESCELIILRSKTIL